jgi:hypothetical protein
MMESVFLVSQTLAVPSSDAVIARLPARFAQIELTVALCPEDINPGLPYTIPTNVVPSPWYLENGIFRYLPVLSAEHVKMLLPSPMTH